MDLEEVEKKWRDALGFPAVILKKKSERRGVTLWLLVQGEPGEMNLLNRKMPGLERLSGWAFLDYLPRGPLGKIDRSELEKIHVEYDCAEEESGFT